MAIETHEAQCPSCGEVNEVDIEIQSDERSTAVTCGACNHSFRYIPPASGELASSDDSREVDCPYCGEANNIDVEPLAEKQSFIEDCTVCCRPIQYTILPAEGDLQISVARSD